MTPSSVALASVVSLFLAACSATEPPPGPARDAQTAVAPQTPSPRAPARALAALQTRDRTMTVFTDHGGLRVTVRDERGKLLGEALTLEELRHSDPFLYQACTDAVAQQGGSYLDARLDLGFRGAPVGR